MALRWRFGLASVSWRGIIAGRNRARKWAATDKLKDFRESRISDKGGKLLAEYDVGFDLWLTCYTQEEIAEEVGVEAP